MGLFKSIKKRFKKLGSSIAKRMRKIGRGVKKGFKKITKAFGKLGPLGQLALFLYCRVWVMCLRLGWDSLVRKY